MKVLLIPLGWDKPDEHKDLVDAFNQNHKAVLFTDVVEAAEFSPDIIFYQGGLSDGDCFGLKMLCIKAKWITWTGDVRYAPMQHLQECKEFTDLFLVPFMGDMLETYSNLLGKPCKFIWEYFPTHRVREPLFFYGDMVNSEIAKVSFVGNVYNCVPGGESRTELAEFINNHINESEIYGSSETTKQIPVEDVPDLYQKSYIVIAENNWQDINGYFTPRNLQGMSSSCCLMKWFPKIERFFTNWHDCVYYHNKYELLDIIEYLKRNPDKRNEIAMNGSKTFSERFTLNNWVEEFIKLAL